MPNRPARDRLLGGQIEQWLDKEKQILRAGDSVFIPPGVVHAAFNVGDNEAKALAIFGPCVGDGIETIDVFNQAPWNSLTESGLIPRP